MQTPEANRLIPGGLPTEALVADVLVAKYADHLPLYRKRYTVPTLTGQAGILA